MLPIAVVSLALSLIALLSVLGLMFSFAGDAFDPADESSGSSGLTGEKPLTGKLSSVSTAPLPGQGLSRQVTEVITDDGGDVAALTCPDTPSVHQGVFTMCHGTVDDEDWAIAVFFEDNQGRFTIGMF